MNEQKDIDISEKISVSENFSIDVFVKETGEAEKNSKLLESREAIKAILKKKTQAESEKAEAKSTEKTKEKAEGNERENAENEKNDKFDFAINDDDKGDSKNDLQTKETISPQPLKEEKVILKTEDSHEESIGSPQDFKKDIIEEIIASSKKSEESEGVHGVESGSEEEDLDDEEYFKSLENS